MSSQNDCLNLEVMNKPGNIREKEEKNNGRICFAKDTKLYMILQNLNFEFYLI